MTMAPHRRRPGPPAQRAGGPAVDAPRPPARPAPAAAPGPYTFLGNPWIRGQSWLYPWLGWGLVALAGFIRPYLALPWWSYLVAGGVTLLLTLSLWASSSATLASDSQRIPVWHVGARLWWVGNWLTGGAWLTGVTATGRSYTPPYLWTIAVAVLVFCLSYPRVRRGQRRHERWAYSEVGGLFDEPAPEPYIVVDPGPEPTAEDINADKWEATFEKAGWRGIEYIAEHAGKCGPVLHMRLPSDGSFNFDQAKAMAERLGIVIGHDRAEGLRPGAIRVQRAKNNAGAVINTEVYVYIDVEDILAEIIWLPDKHTPLSIYKAFPVGKFADGTYIYLNLSQIHSMIVGMTRSGKSNLLHVMLFQLSRCTDAVIWMYDGKNGATARLWLQPWLDGELDPTTGEPLAHPVIDWVAIDRLEVERQFLALVAMAKARPLIRAKNGSKGDKWMATPADPAVFYICDELAESIGAHTGPAWASTANGATSADLGRIFTSVLTMGAGEKIHVIGSGQRGTVTMFGSGDAKSQIKGRIAFEQSSTGDGSEVFQKAHEATLVAATLSHPGSVVVEGFGYPDPLPGKIFLAGTDANLAIRIRAAVIEHTPLRPELDEGTERVANRFGYAERWTDPDRTWWLRGHEFPPPTLRRFAGVGVDPASTAVAVADPAVAGSPFSAAFAALEAGELPGHPGGGTGPAEPDKALTEREGETWEQLERQFLAEQARASLAGQAQPEAAQDAGDSAGYRRFLAILDEAGTNGVTMTAMWNTLVGEGLAPRARGTLYTWRDRGSRDDRVVYPTPGRNAPMYDKRHLAG